MVQIGRFQIWLCALSCWVGVANATSFHEAFAALRNSGLDFESTGSICEQVARLELSEEYQAPVFSVVTGVVYANSDRVLGELDVVVFNNSTQSAIAVSEVKCWKNISKGLRKAREQRRRFISALNSKVDLEFYSLHGHVKYHPTQFKSVSDFSTIAQKGAKDEGYDAELELSLSDLMRLRQSLIQCQRTGECPRPQ